MHGYAFNRLYLTKSKIILAFGTRNSSSFLNQSLTNGVSSIIIGNFSTYNILTLNAYNDI